MSVVVILALAPTIASAQCLGGGLRDALERIEALAQQLQELEARLAAHESDAGAHHEPGANCDNTAPFASLHAAIWPNAISRA